MPWGVFSIKVTSLTGMPWLLKASATWTRQRNEAQTKLMNPKTDGVGFTSRHLMP